MCKVLPPLTYPVVCKIVQDQSRTEGTSRVDATAGVADLQSATKRQHERECAVW